MAETVLGSALMAMRGVQNVYLTSKLAPATKALVDALLKNNDLCIIARALSRVAADPDPQAEQCVSRAREMLTDTAARWRCALAEGLDQYARHISDYVSVPQNVIGPSGVALAVAGLVRCVEHGCTCSRRGESRARLAKALDVRHVPWGGRLFKAVVLEMAKAGLPVPSEALDIVSPAGVQPVHRAQYFLGRWTKQTHGSVDQKRRKVAEDKRVHRFPSSERPNGWLGTFPAALRAIVDDFLPGGVAMQYKLASTSKDEWLWATGWSASSHQPRGVTAFTTSNIDGSFLAQNCVSSAHSTKRLWTRNASKLYVSAAAVGMWCGVAWWLMHGVNVRALTQVVSTGGPVVFLLGRVKDRHPDGRPRTWPTMWPNVSKVIVSGDPCPTPIRMDCLVRVINPDVIQHLELDDGVSLFSTAWVWHLPRLQFLAWVKHVLTVRVGDKEEEEEATDIHPEDLLWCYVAHTYAGGRSPVTAEDARAALVYAPTLLQLCVHPQVLNGVGLCLLSPLCGERTTVLTVRWETDVDDVGMEWVDDVDGMFLPVPPGYPALRVRDVVVPWCTTALLERMASRVLVYNAVEITIGAATSERPAVQLLQSVHGLAAQFKFLHVCMRNATAANVHHELNTVPGQEPGELLARCVGKWTIELMGYEDPKDWALVPGILETVSAHAHEGAVFFHDLHETDVEVVECIVQFSNPFVLDFVTLFAGPVPPRR